MLTRGLKKGREDLVIFNWNRFSGNSARYVHSKLKAGGDLLLSKLVRAGESNFNLWTQVSMCLYYSTEIKHSKLKNNANLSSLGRPTYNNKEGNVFYKPI